MENKNFNKIKHLIVDSVAFINNTSIEVRLHLFIYLNI
jgi:hypothetical protein